ncbi:hypothetical protein [Corynebacterium heidelbergense]|uniref:Uncharacterized protein n=1 Tax=Corynebacterium heidelbergense TaxID=2055947 RepID=A0A364V8V0_9CORY|nr:hypothetical protein [Corynebacterium heidelbergense]RAV33061.1 hypothetical protein DLJ54_00500 [Corynebacterium heidelbergense]
MSDSFREQSRNLGSQIGPLSEKVSSSLRRAFGAGAGEPTEALRLSSKQQLVLQTARRMAPTVEALGDVDANGVQARKNFCRKAQGRADFVSKSLENKPLPRTLGTAVVATSAIQAAADNFMAGADYEQAAAWYEIAAAACLQLPGGMLYTHQAQLPAALFWLSGALAHAAANELDSAAAALRSPWLGNAIAPQGRLATAHARLLDLLGPGGEAVDLDKAHQCALELARQVDEVRAGVALISIREMTAVDDKGTKLTSASLGALEYIVSAHLLRSALPKDGLFDPAAPSSQAASARGESELSSGSGAGSEDNPAEGDAAASRSMRGPEAVCEEADAALGDEQFDRAEQLYNEVGRQTEPDNPNALDLVVRATCGIALCSDGRGNSQAARERLETAVPELSKVGDPKVAARAWELRARWGANGSLDRGELLRSWRNAGSKWREAGKIPDALQCQLYIAVEVANEDKKSSHDILTRIVEEARSLQLFPIYCDAVRLRAHSFAYAGDLKRAVDELLSIYKGVSADQLSDVRDRLAYGRLTIALASYYLRAKQADTSVKLLQEAREIYQGAGLPEWVEDLETRIAEIQIGQLRPSSKLRIDNV